MIIWLRNIVFIFLFLTLVYVVLSFNSRLKQVAKLKTEYEIADPKESEEDFIASGMKKYYRSYRPKLIIAVYLVPLAIMSLLIYLAQYN